MRRGLVWSGYGIVLVLAGIGLREMWQAHYEVNLLTSRQRIHESITEVENLLKASNDHVNMLRISATDNLSHLNEGGRAASPLYHHVLAAPDFGGYCSEADGHTHLRRPVSLSGLGQLPSAGSPLADEINMALMLNPQFAATAENIPNMAWAYYISASRFIAIYPFVSCNDFHFTDDDLEQGFFKLGQPGLNPARKAFWTEAYVDGAGKGLMATVGAPVYDGSRFLGTVAIDLTLEVLSQYVKHSDIHAGTAFIVNEQGQLLAHPTLVSRDDSNAHNVTEAIGLHEPMKLLRESLEDTFVSHGDTVVYTKRLAGAPWRYVYISERSSLVKQALLDSKLELIGFLMVITMIIVFENARLRGTKLKANNDALEAAQDDLRQALDRAEAAETKAREANQAKSIMLANASHDLRTPLNAIIGFSELILSKLHGSIGSAKYEEYIQDIHASGNLLLAIVNDVLDLSKIEAGRYEMTEEILEVDRILKLTEHLVSTQAARSNIDLSLDIQADIPHLRADRRAMQQIMLNLLSNAIKFTPAGGKVRVRATRSQNGSLKIEVEDTGKGISQRDLQVLFTPFSRGASASTSNTQGTGLGLSIVKAMIELHGGCVELTSELGHGTKVTLHLPESRMVPAAGTMAA
jgi:signal transduction histidine kinase